MSSSMYEIPEGGTGLPCVDSAQLLALEMVSFSPDGLWGVHPFNGVDFQANGLPGFDVDGGFVLYTTGTPNRAREYTTGPSATWWSAEWIDSKRFVVTGMTEVDLPLGQEYVYCHAPSLCFGRVDSPEITWVTGPPVPLQYDEASGKSLDEYRKNRYPRFWKAVQ